MKGVHAMATRPRKRVRAPGLPAVKGELLCPGCGFSVMTARALAGCPQCGGVLELAPWRPFSRALHG